MMPTTHTTGPAATPPGAALDFKSVGEHVARNPVARAIARATLAAEVRDFTLRLYLLPDGALVNADCQVSARVLAVALEVLQATGGAGSPDGRVMQGGMGALVDIARRGFKWRQADAVALDQALQRALNTYNTSSAQQVQDAHRRVAAQGGQA